MKIGTLWIAAAVLTIACGRNDTRMTLNGCLQSGEQGLASPEPGAPPAQPTENIDRFVLANATTTAAKPGTTAAPLYVLDGKKDELRAHLSHQVEVTGHLANSTSEPANAQKFDVESVRMVAAQCAP